MCGIFLRKKVVPMKRKSNAAVSARLLVGRDSPRLSYKWNCLTRGIFFLEKEGRSDEKSNAAASAQELVSKK